MFPKQSNYFQIFWNKEFEKKSLDFALGNNKTNV